MAPTIRMGDMARTHGSCLFMLLHKCNTLVHHMALFLPIPRCIVIALGCVTACSALLSVIIFSRGTWFDSRGPPWGTTASWPPRWES